MIPVTFNSAAAYLLDDQPDWSGGISVEASIPAMYERGLSGRETRRPTGDTLRLVLKYSAVLTSSAAIVALRNALQAISTERVLCPFWPAGFVAGATPLVTAAYYALFNADGSFNSIAAAAGLPFALPAYPLMVGILPESPDPVLAANGTLTVDYKFADADNYPLTPAAFSAPNGLTATGGAGLRPLFPFLPDWSSLPHSGDSEQDIERRAIGVNRTLASAYYAQRGRRTTTQFFTLAGADGFNLLRFFADLGGEQNNFWLGAAVCEAALAGNLASGATSMTVDNGAALGTNAFILLSDGAQRVPLAVSSVAGNTWNLLASPGTGFAAGRTTIESLVLARFDTLKLTLNFSTPNLATAQVRFKELPWETNAVAGETYGTTMGALPATATLYQFTLTTPSGEQYWYLTNFERDLTNAGHTYLSAPMENSEIVETATLERQMVSLKSRNFANNPLALLLPFQLEWPLMLDIYEADVSGTTAVNLRCYFHGEVGKCEVEPPFIDATCETLSSIFDRQIPRRLYQRNDNWCLFETANGLTPANWQWNARVASYNAASGTLVVNTITSANGATLGAHWFAAGYLIVTTAGVAQVRMIGDNAAPSAGSMTLYLSSPLFTAPAVNDVVNLFAGYDGQAQTAIGKFFNYLNFGGFPFMPVGNPTTMRAVQPKGGGKK